VSNGSNGSASLVGGNVVYTPDADFNGTDTITYTISDGNGATDTATMSIKVHFTGQGNEFGVATSDRPESPLIERAHLGNGENKDVHEVSRAVVRAVHKTGNIGNLLNIDGVDNVILEAVNLVDDLNTVSAPEPQTGAVLAVISEFERARILKVANLDGEFAPRDFKGFSIEWHDKTSEQAERQEGIKIEALSSQNITILQISEIHGNGDAFAIKDFSITLADGRVLPKWLVKGSGGTLIGEPPANAESINLHLTVTLHDGSVLSKYFVFRPKTGEIDPLDVKSIQETGSLFSDQLLESTRTIDDHINVLADALASI
jgi:hypothetical protein